MMFDSSQAPWGTASNNQLEAAGATTNIISEKGNGFS